MQKEGLFRVAAADAEVRELEIHMSQKQLLLPDDGQESVHCIQLLEEDDA